MVSNIWLIIEQETISTENVDITTTSKTIEPSPEPTEVTPSTVEPSTDSGFAVDSDETTLPGDKEEPSSTTEEVVPSLPQVVASSSEESDKTSDIEDISSTTNTGLDETTLQPQSTEASIVDETNDLTTIEPVVSSEVVETTDTTQSSSSTTVSTVEEESIDTTIKIDASNTEGASEGSIDEVITTTVIPQSISTSSDPVEVDADDQESDDEMSTESPEQDLGATEVDQTIVVSTEPSSEEDGSGVISTTMRVETSDSGLIEEEGSGSIGTESTVEEDIMTRCLFNDIFYEHTQNMPSDNKCELCQCVDGIRVCAERECPPPPENYKNCQKIENEESCCPQYECDELTTARSEEEEAISTSREPNLIPATDILPDDSAEETTVDDNLLVEVEKLPDTVEAMTQTTEMSQTEIFVTTEMTPETTVQVQVEEKPKEKMSMMCILLGDCKGSQPQGEIVGKGGDMINEAENEIETSVNDTSIDIMNFIRDSLGALDGLLGPSKNTIPESSDDAKPQNTTVNFIRDSLGVLDGLLVPRNNTLPESSDDAMPQNTTANFIRDSLGVLDGLLGPIKNTIPESSDDAMPQNTAAMPETSSTFNEKDTGEALPLFKESDLDNEILDDDSDDSIFENISEDEKNCLFDGVSYKHLASVPSEDPCKLCFCQYGMKLCASRDCAIPIGYEECTPLPKAEGKCCPDQFECSKYTSFFKSRFLTLQCF